MPSGPGPRAGSGGPPPGRSRPPARPARRGGRSWSGVRSVAWSALSAGGRSGEDLADPPARGVGQALVPAVVGEGQPGVVEPEQVEDGGVEVVDVGPVALGPEPDGVCRAVDGAPPDPAAGDPH